MKRRNVHNSSGKLSEKSVGSVRIVNIKPGEILTDLSGNRWKLGDAIGLGGFGEIFSVSPYLHLPNDHHSEFVAKIETHSSGPLFVEINCYLKIAKEKMIEEWKSRSKVLQLGIPNYVASGSHFSHGLKYRFLIIPRFKMDLESMLEQKKHKLNLKTVLTMGIQLIDILQYIHSKGFVHADIKPSNILLNLKNELNKTSKINSKIREESDNNGNTMFRYDGNLNGNIRMCRIKKVVLRKNLRTNSNLHYLNDISVNEQMETHKSRKGDQLYLLDYGLASKYLLSNGEHKEFAVDQRKAHAGTLLFCSLDAHQGAQSRRSDLESLGYNMIYWLTSNLPWSRHTDDPEIVYKSKKRCLSSPDIFLTFTFGDYPNFLYEYFNYLNTLDFISKPDYAFCKKLFSNALYDYGYKNDNSFDFDNFEVKGRLNIKRKLMEPAINEKILKEMNRTPLRSNVFIRPQLRKKDKNKKLRNLKWSKIWMDPEEILKQAKMRERKCTTDSTDAVSSLMDLDIYELNPTDEMLRVYNNYIKKVNSPNASPHHNDWDECNNPEIEGYTPAMVKVYRSMYEEHQLAIVPYNVSKRKSKAKKLDPKRQPMRISKRLQKNSNVSSISKLKSKSYRSK